MRLVLCVANFPQSSETFIISKFVGLLDRGWDVHVVCRATSPADWTSYQELETRPGIRSRVHLSWPVHPTWLVFLRYPLAFLRCLAANPRGLLAYFRRGFKIFSWKILQKFFLDYPFVFLKPDLVHFEFGALAVGNEKLAHCLGCKMTVSFRGYDLNFSGLEQADYYDKVWRQADCLHFLGEDLRRRALRRGCPLHKPYVLIPPAIDTTFFAPAGQEIAVRAGVPARPLHILSVGRLEWKKGYEFALQAVRELVNRGIACEYRIVGSGAYLPAVAFARSQLSLQTCVELLGGMPRDKVAAQLKWADVFLHAAVSEGFCNAVLEAQSAGVPVVCSDAGGLPENVLDEITGFITPRREVRAVAGRLEQLAWDAQLRHSMGLAGRERVRTNFNLENQIKAFEQFYSQVMSDE